MRAVLLCPRTRTGSARALGCCLVLSLVLPFAVSAKESLISGSEGAVARGEFIRSAVKTLRLPLVDGGELPYGRIPKALRPYVQTAYDRQALEVFGNDLRHGRAITRGEALQILMRLQNLRVKKVKVQYLDVDVSGPEGEAVQIAVDKQWLKPEGGDNFGVDSFLMAKESKLLLRRIGRGVTGDDVPGGTVQEVVPTIRVKLQVQKPQPFPKEEILQTIWQLLQQQYLYKDKLKADEAAYKAAEGLVESLNDPYTVFMRPTRSEQFQTQIQGELSGIGAQVELKGNVLVIVAPIEGSPAQKAGLLPGDEVLSVDGSSIAGLSLEDAVMKIRGPKGTTVKLRVRRNGVEFDVPVVRDVIKVPEIEISFQGTIAVVKLHQFGQTTERDLRMLMKKVQEQRPTGLVLDLRNNPGGLLHAAEIVLSNFLPLGSPIAQIATLDQKTVDVTEEPPTIVETVRMVVIVNKGSASASEIVAGALQDAKRAKIIGQQTFGKGTVQQLLQFRDGSTLKMTIAEWLTPAGRKIDGVGVEPDMLVEEEERDGPLRKALDILR